MLPTLLGKIGPLAWPMVCLSILLWGVIFTIALGYYFAWRAGADQALLNRLRTYTAEFLAPLGGLGVSLGLLGTVIGCIQAFFAPDGSLDTRAVAGGISDAYYSTGFAMVLSLIAMLAVYLFALVHEKLGGQLAPAPVASCGASLLAAQPYPVATARPSSHPSRPAPGGSFASAAPCAPTTPMAETQATPANTTPRAPVESASREALSEPQLEGVPELLFDLSRASTLHTFLRTGARLLAIHREILTSSGVQSRSIGAVSELILPPEASSLEEGSFGDGQSLEIEPGDYLDSVDPTPLGPDNLRALENLDAQPVLIIHQALMKRLRIHAKELLQSQGMSDTTAVKAVRLDLIQDQSGKTHLKRLEVIHASDNGECRGDRE